jgi:hypothetical protein
MSLVLAVLYESNWLREDGAKLFFFGSCFLALLVLARLASKRSESNYNLPQHLPEPELPPPFKPPAVYKYEEDPDEGEAETDPSELPKARSVEFALKSIRFKGFEMEIGPEDPESFCDYAVVNIRYRGGDMPWDFIVATPRGLEAKMTGEGWQSVFVRQQALLVSRWDAQLITGDLLHRIEAELEAVPEEVAEDEMKEADGRI